MNAHIFILHSRVYKKILYNKVLSYTKIAFLPLDKYLFVGYSTMIIWSACVMGAQL